MFHNLHGLKVVTHDGQQGAHIEFSALNSSGANLGFFGSTVLGKAYKTTHAFLKHTDMKVCDACKHTHHDHPNMMGSRIRASESRTTIMEVTTNE